MAEKLSLKHDWPIAAVAGGILLFWIASRSSSNAGGASSPSTSWPRIYGGETGTPSRQSARTTDSGSLAAQVIGDIVGQRVALAQGKDQVTIAENATQAQTQEAQIYANEMQQQLQTEQQISQQQQPQWWQYLLGGLGGIFGLGGASGAGGAGGFNPLGWLTSLFGGGNTGSQQPFGVMPPGMGVPWGIGNPGPWGWPGSSSNGYGGYYPYLYYPSPYGSGSWI